MTNINETATYSPNIYQLDTSDPVLGGTPVFDMAGNPTSGYSNAPIKQLADRTAYLKNAVDSASDNITLLEQDLVNSTDPAKGAGMVGYGGGTVADALQNLAQLADLDALPVAGPAAGTDVLLIKQAAGNRKISVDVVRTEFAVDAVAAAEEANVARDAAQLAAGVFSSTSAALAATTDGQYFSVPSDNSGEFLILYVNAAGVAVEVKRYPSAAALEAVVDVARIEVDQPNIFTSKHLSFDTLPSVVDGAVVKTVVAGLNAGRVTTNPVTGASRWFWRFPAASFVSGYYSAQLTLTSTAGTSGEVRLLERNGLGTTIKTTVIATGLAAAITDPRVFSVAGVALAPATVSVDLDVVMSNTAGSKERTTDVRSMLICDGGVDTFRQPPVVIPAVPTVNLFPNAALTATAASLFEAVTTVDAGEVALELSGAGVVKQVFYDTPAVGALAPGNTLTFAAQAFADVGGSMEDADITVIFRDSGGITLSSSAPSSITAPNVYQSLSVTTAVPTGTAAVRFRFVKRASATVARFRRPLVTSTSPLANIVSASGSSATVAQTVYVSPTGSDLNSGAIGSPLASISAAVAKVSPIGRVIVREGDYAAGASVTGCTDIDISAAPNERVRIILGTPLSGITKTAGRTKVYQANLAVKPNKWIWEHDTPDTSTLIAPADRLALQRGRACRLPSTRLDEVTSIAEIDASGSPAWFWQDGVIYFSASDGGDASTRNYRVPTTNNGAVFGGTGVESVTLRGISVWYAGIYGFDARNLVRWEAENCGAFCGQLNGFSRDDTRFSVERYCEAAGNAGDGFNAHRYTGNVHHEPVISTSYDNWSHDNYDDGDSYHEDCIGTYFGGLYEYNGDRGIATAYGAHTTAYNTVSRYNGQIDTLGGEGFCAIGAVAPADDNGVGTQMECYNCQAYGNSFNYRTNAPDASMSIIDSKAGDALSVHYANTDGSMRLMDCSTFGTGVVKTGTVSVQNTTVVT